MCLGLRGGLEEQVAKLNQYLIKRGYPGLRWEPCWPVRFHSLVYKDMPLPRIPNMEPGIPSKQITIDPNTQAAQYYMDYDGSNAKYAIDALDKWIEDTNLEEMPKLLNTELTVLARIALEQEK